MSEATSTTANEDCFAELSPELLQGIPLHVCFHRGRSLWNRAGRARSGASQTARHYSYFLSHAWAASSWSKYFALLVHFNGVPSAMAAFLTGLILGILTSLQVMPFASWMPILAHLVPASVLFLWQDLRRVVCDDPMVFLDCACIPQGDDAVKAKCVRGLPSFLRRSDNLVVLWSPDFVRRLWCTYEVAFFLKQNQADQILFLPLQVPTLWFLIYLVAGITRTTLYIAEIMGLYGDSVVGYLGIVGGVFLAQQLTIWPAVYYVLTNMLRDIAELPEQLHNFRVQDAGCSCCAKGHVDRVTKQQIPCDRKLIYEMLESWFQPVKSAEEALDQFNLHVRDSLAPQVERTSRPSLLILKHGVAATAVACFPYLSADIFMTVDRIKRQTAGALLYPAGQLYTFLVILVGVRIMALIGYFGLRYSQRCCRAAVLVGQVALHASFTFVMMMLWISWHLVGGEHSHFALFAVGILSCCTAYVLFPLSRGFFKSNHSSSKAAQEEGTHKFTEAALAAITHNLRDPPGLQHALEIECSQSLSLDNDDLIQEHL